MSHYGKCKHGIYLGVCRKCFPLPEFKESEREMSPADELQELKALVKSFFEDYLDYQEESDSGRVFNPIHINCARVMMIKSLDELLNHMKELSGAK